MTGFGGEKWRDGEAKPRQRTYGVASAEVSLLEEGIFVLLSHSVADYRMCEYTANHECNFKDHNDK